MIKEEIQRVYDIRPSTANSVVGIIEIIDRIVTSEYLRGYNDRQNINKGEWVRETDATSSENSILYKCSVCGNTHSNIYKRGKIHGEWSDNVLIEKFCNNCGADMRGTKDE